jgi:hypothetical protein
MSKGQDYKREEDGFRLDFGGINTVLPPDQLPPTRFPYAQNIRRYQQRRVTGRATQDVASLALAGVVNTMRRLNDTTPAGPPEGFILISGSGNNLNAGSSVVDSGMSGNPLSLVPFRPNQSVQPWMYVADENKMLKVRSDGTTYKMGIKEPQSAPNVTANVVSASIAILGNVTLNYWGDSPHSGPVGVYIWKNGKDTSAPGPIRAIGDQDGTTTGSSFLFDVPPAYGRQEDPMKWTELNPDGSVAGLKSVFEPALESEGYSDFNFSAQCSLYVPAPGAYTFKLNAVNGCLWGIGGDATWAGKGGHRGKNNQTMTAIDGLPLMPCLTTNQSWGAQEDQNVIVTFPAAGIYPFEIDYDFWYHSRRTLTIYVNGANLNPLPDTIIVDAIYRYVYRSSATGAVSNPSPASTAVNLPVSSTTITPVPSSDPQVDKIDWYRQDAGLLNFTYVGTSPNSATSFNDTLLDTDVAANPLLEFDNFEPFPSIDLPRKGVVNVLSGVATWVSGDVFNLRWLPGTVVVVGTVAYTFDKRPTSTTTFTALGLVDGTNLPYEIAQPILAAQPMPAMWGPTDNIAFMFGCGDPLRPGTLYWTKGNNPDSAPDTNQQEVTSPSEPLINGCIIGGIGLVFSDERAWLIYPNFFNALATVTGTAGSTWSLVESIATRGLFVRKGLCTDGGGTAFFRAKDGIYISPGGTGCKSITDNDLYNLFPHEGFQPSPITLGGYTIYPPDDSLPDAQKLSSANGYVYYDYIGSDGNYHTLVFDIAAMAWVVDVYSDPASAHALEDGPAVNGTLTGCVSGNIRPLVNGGQEPATSVLLTQCVNFGDARSNNRIGDVFLRGTVGAGDLVNVFPYSGLYQNALTGYSPLFLTPQGIQAKYIIDFNSGGGQETDDFELLLTWLTKAATSLDLWQPNFVDLPISTQDRPTDWDDCGQPGAKFIQGFLLEADTFNAAKAFTVQSGDDLSFHVPNESPVTMNGQMQRAFTFTPPFVAHTIRLFTTDGVPWRMWGLQWVFTPYPELVVQWQSPGTSHGLQGWQHIRELNIAHISTADLTLTLTPDVGDPIVLIVPNSNGIHTKTKVTPFRNKFKIVSYQVTSAEPFRLFESDLEVKVRSWGSTDAYQIVQPFGGPSRAAAAV